MLSRLNEVEEFKYSIPKMQKRSNGNGIDEWIMTIQVLYTQYSELDSWSVSTFQSDHVVSILEEWRSSNKQHTTYNTQLTIHNLR